MSSTLKRPPHRVKGVFVSMDEKFYNAAVRKADNPKRLPALLRALVAMWLRDEYPSSPEELVEQQLRRAPKRPRQE